MKTVETCSSTQSPPQSPSSTVQQQQQQQQQQIHGIASNFGPLLQSLKKPPPQPGQRQIPIHYSAAAATPRRVSNRPRSPARFADIGSLNVLTDDTVDEDSLMSDAEAQLRQLAQMSSAKRIIMAANANQGHIGASGRARPTEEELEEKLQSVSSFLFYLFFIIKSFSFSK